MKRFLLAAVRLYQRTLSLILPVQCRFWPSCSNYFSEAVERHGALRGSALGLWRLLRCHPLGGSGYDPVPPARGAVGTARRDEPPSSEPPNAASPSAEPPNAAPSND